MADLELFKETQALDTPQALTTTDVLSALEKDLKVGKEAAKKLSVFEKIGWKAVGGDALLQRCEKLLTGFKSVRKEKKDVKKPEDLVKVIDKGLEFAKQVKGTTDGYKKYIGEELANVYDCVDFTIQLFPLLKESVDSNMSKNIQILNQVFGS